MPKCIQMAVLQQQLRRRRRRWCRQRAAEQGLCVEAGLLEALSLIIRKSMMVRHMGRDAKEPVVSSFISPLMMQLHSHIVHIIAADGQMHVHIIA